MVTDNTKEIWETIDAIVDAESMIEKHYNRLVELGFRRKEVDEIVDCFVVHKLKKLMEEK